MDSWLQFAQRKLWLNINVFYLYFLKMFSLCVSVLQKEYLEREIEKRVIRTSPLGKDRDYNRYWFFRRDGRIFVESSDSVEWGYYSSKEEV